MKIIVQTETLKNAIDLVYRAIPTRPTHPILGCILLEPMGTALSLSGFDLKIGIQTTINAQIDDPDPVAVPAAIFKDIVSRLPKEEEIILETVENGESVQILIKTLGGEFAISGMSPEDFPSLPTVTGDDILSVALPVEVFKSALAFCLSAASTDETKQILTGVHLTHKEGRLEVAATDGHRLSRFIHDVEANDFTVTIPASSLKDIVAAISPDSESVSFTASESLAVFNLETSVISTRVLEGAYPLYNSLFPSEFKRRVILEKKDLTQALSLVSVFADPKHQTVKLTIEDGTMSLSIESADIGSGEQSIPCTLEGEPIDIVFNLKYLTQGLSPFASGQIQFNLNQNDTPATIQTPGDGTKDYLIMPVKIRK